MRSEGLEGVRSGTGLLHRLDARLKLIATLGFLITVVATPMGAWRGFGAEGLVLAFVVGLAGLAPRDLGRRWLGMVVLVGFLVLMIAPAHPARARYGLGVVAASLLIKNGLALLAMLVLSGTTPFPKLLTALRRLRLPPLLVTTLQFMERYRHVLLDQLDRMTTARRARTFRRPRTLSWSLLGGLIGMLFLRTFERAERIHGAMLARGWTGTLHHLDDGPTPGSWDGRERFLGVENPQDETVSAGISGPTRGVVW